MNEIPPTLPPEATDAYKQYLGLPLTDKGILKSKIADYMKEIAGAAGQNQFTDSPTAEEIAGGLLRLIDHVEDSHLIHAQAAVYYFVESEDAYHDMDSVIGFDDDLEVYNAVCDHLGYGELRLEF